ncbi:MAG: hypothetical protein ACUVX9_14080 [Anaerolineae bacterium]
MAKTYECYVTNGLCRIPRQSLDLSGVSELVLYNPTSEPCRTTMTVYYADRAPRTLPPIEVPAERNLMCQMPEMDPGAFGDCGFWGARLECTAPVIAVLSDTLTYAHDDPTFKGGATHFLGTGLSRQWHFADGLWLEHYWNYRGDREKLAKHPFPFNEIEYYYFLNPNPRPARVDMTLQFRRLEHETFHLRVPAERVLVWCNLDKIPYNQAYGVKVVASDPIATASTRFIYGLYGFQDWGLTPHTGMPAVVGGNWQAS